ncbi:hypothetical protein [Streptococcus marmotae]|uniref:hypothetical protein n=1 Tax=Streptococcus marmotae TaxID=1825069 RepID=UPI00082ADE27|nr:hypothetical protein [Streptococcus marmotae]
MKLRKLLTLFSATILAGAILAGCSSSQHSQGDTSESTTSKTTEVTKETEKQASDLESEYLTLDPKTVEGFELSDLVKEAAGTYAGIVEREGSHETKEYQVKINKDGTYLMLSRQLTPSDTYTITYLDSTNTPQHKTLEPTVNGKQYYIETNRNFSLQRGVVIERFGRLNLVPLKYDVPIMPFLDQNGKLDFTKGIISAAYKDNKIDSIIDTDKELEAFLRSHFDYSKKLPETLSSQFIFEAGKLMNDETEIPKSEAVETFLTQDLTESLAKEKMLQPITSANDLFQFIFYSYVNISDLAPFKVLTDFSNVYTEDGQQVNPQYAIIADDYLYKGRTICAYYNGDIYFGPEDHGKFILRETSRG